MPKTYTATAQAYARDVVAGKIAACKWVRAACQRQLDDRNRWRAKTQAGCAKGKSPYWFDTEKAEAICRFVELMPHIKGDWARRGEKIQLEPWQVFILTTVFGWYNKAGQRRFRTVYVEVPRKNAKSTLSSAVGLYMLTEDGEAGAEIYSAATTADQARIVFAAAQAMARKSPPMREYYGLDVAAHSIHVLSTQGFFRALSAEGSTLDGLNVHCAVVDELHAHKTRAVFDVLETATGARSQPLLWNITTAGSNRAGVCYEQRTYVTKLLEGVADDPSYFGIIYTIDDDDDWTDPTVWAKANPNYGVSVYPDDIARLCRKAMEMPSAQNNFLTKRLNVWVNADTAWMSMVAWDKCADLSLSIDDFTGEPCFIALDLASKTDLAAKVTMFERKQDGQSHYYLFGRYYLPEEAAEDGRNSQYSGWARDGRLVLTPGNVTDYAYIEDDLREDAGRFEIKEVPYDPFQATQLSTRMIDEGFPMVEVRPTVLNFSEPMKSLEALVMQGRMHHDGDPVLAWMISNVVAHLDNKDNIYPRKERPENKIDGVMAAIMCLARAMVHEDKPNVYQTRGVRGVFA